MTHSYVRHDSFMCGTIALLTLKNAGDDATTHCNTIEGTATQFKGLQQTRSCAHTHLDNAGATLPNTALHCNTLQHTAEH